MRSGNDGLLVILAPQAVTNPATVAKQLTKRKRSTGKPIIAGDLPATARVEVAGKVNRVRSEGREMLTEAESKNILAAYGIPTVPTEVALSVEEAIEIA